MDEILKSLFPNLSREKAEMLFECLGLKGPLGKGNCEGHFFQVGYGVC